MKNLLYHTLYSPNAYGHGGEKRTAQLAEILEDAKLNRVIFDSDNSKTSFSIISIFRSIITIFTVYQFHQFKSLRIFLRFWKNLTLQYPSLISFFKHEEKIFIWESTKDIFYYLPYLGKKKNKQVIALPHNLESLVPEQKSIMSGKLTPVGFPLEIEVLKQCDAVFAISREETLMLKLFGVNAFYLPYYPTRIVEQYLLSIRKKRECRTINKRKQILLMGSAINPPTRHGMENRIRFFEKNKIENVDLRVGGYGTEVLQISFPNFPQIKLLGELTIMQLENELINTDALLIHQPATTGALTRIIEMLIAGIPVFVNEESARSYFGVDGVFIYENDNQLLDLLSSFLSIPCLPSKPSYSLFLETIT